MTTRLAFARSVAFVVVAGTLGAPAELGAQTPASSFPELATRLKVGSVVYVTDREGREQKGTLVEVTGSSLTLTTGSRRLDFGDRSVTVIRQRKPDSCLNGAVIGAVAGAASVYAPMLSGGDYWDPGGWGAIFALGGAAVGAALDLAIPGKKIVVFQASSSSAVHLSVLPLVSPKQLGVTLAVRF